MYLDFFGRFHPVLVHLPIGFLLLAVLFHWIGKRTSFSYLRLSVPVILVLGMLSGLFACLTGLALSQQAEYPESLLGWHQWLGIGTTFLSLVFFWALQRKKALAANVVSLVIFAGVSITGHFGGSLTHGEDYLSLGPGVAEPALLPIADIQAAHAYNDLVQPIFEARCVSCHGASKQKGNLRLDNMAMLLKGGEDGVVLKPGDAENSELISRLLLPAAAKQHMPPISSAQVTEPEIQLLQWWVRSGASFDQVVKDIPQTEVDKGILSVVQAASKGEAIDTALLGAKQLTKKGIQPVHTLTAGIPEKEVKPGDAAAIQQLKAAGVVVLPVSQGSNYLSVNFVSVASPVPDSVMALLPALRNQLIWLKLDEQVLGEKSLAVLAQLTELTRLQLSYTNISDETIVQLKPLQQLQWLNLVGSPVSTMGISKLAPLPALKQLFLYRASLHPGDFPKLEAAFPGVQIDTGNYRLPLLPGDTSLVK